MKAIKKNLSLNRNQTDLRQMQCQKRLSPPVSKIEHRYWTFKTNISRTGLRQLGEGVGWGRGWSE